MFRQSRPFSYSPRSFWHIVEQYFSYRHSKCADDVYGGCKSRAALSFFFFSVQLQRFLAGRLPPAEATYTE